MKDLERTQEIRAELLLFLVVFIWGSNYPLAKFAIAKMDAFVFNSIRFVVAAMLLTAISSVRGELRSVRREDWKEVLRAGFVANVLYQSAFIVGLSMTNAGNAAVLMATSPLWTIVINARLHREKIHRQVWMGMIVSLCGVVMIIVGSGKELEFGGYAIIGDVVCLAAAVLWAFNTNMQKPLLTRYSPLHLATVMISIGAIAIALVATPFALRMQWEIIGWQHWFATVLSGVLSIGIANVIWSYGVQRIGPRRTSIFSNLIPVVAFVLSYVAWSEQVNMMQIVGSVITIAGVWLARG
jgi:drug/metabolite transporter (DMT)-like permease